MDKYVYCNFKIMINCCYCNDVYVQTIIPIINVKTSGWQWVFYFLMAMVCAIIYVAAVCASLYKHDGMYLCCARNVCACMPSKS